MLFNSDLESKMENQEKQLNELLLHFEGLEKNVSALYEQLDLTPKEISEYIDVKEHFTDEMWNQLQEQKKHWSDRLKMMLDLVPNPEKTKKARQSLNTQPHWIHVR